MSLYDEIINFADKGKRCVIDIKFRTLTVRNKSIDLSGYKPEDLIDYNVIGVDPNNIDDVCRYIIELYEQLQVTLPSMETDRRKSKPFVGLPIESMSPWMLESAGRRGPVLARLECFILFSIMNGIITWQKLSKNSESTFVILNSEFIDKINDELENIKSKDGVKFFEKARKLVILREWVDGPTIMIGDYANKGVSNRDSIHKEETNEYKH